MQMRINDVKKLYIKYKIITLSNEKKITNGHNYIKHFDAYNLPYT